MRLTKQTGDKQRLNKIAVEFSLGLKNKQESAKWNENNKKFVYGNWFTSPDAVALKLAGMLPKLKLPVKVLGLNVIIPYEKTPSYLKRIKLDDKQTQITDEKESQGKGKWITYYAITVNNEVLEEIAPWTLYKQIKMLKPEADDANNDSDANDNL